MADIGIGALGYVGYAKETVEGTAVAPTKFLTANSINFNDTNDYLTPYVINGSRDMYVAMPAPYNVTGTLELNLPADDIGYLLKSAFAASVSTSAYSGGGYTHVMTPGNSSNTFTFEHAAQDVLYMRHTGVRVNTLTLKSAFGEIVTASFGLDGIDRSKYTGSPATPSYATSSPYPFHFNGATVTIASVANSDVKDWSLNVNNNVSHIGTLRATRSYRRVALGTREITLSMTADFQTGTEYDRMLNDDEFAISLYLEGGAITGGTGKNSLKIDLPRVKYKAVGLPINAGDFLSQSFECTVLKPTGSAIATVTLVNAETSLA